MERPKTAIKSKKPTAKSEVIKKEEVNWKDLEGLPLDVRRMVAMSFSWITLKKGCSSEALAPICRDPEFWFQKLKQEKMVLDRPIVRRWIKLWLNTPVQNELLNNLEKGQYFSLGFVSGLILTEFNSKGNNWGKQLLSRSDPLVILAQETHQNQVNVQKSIGELIELESVEDNLNTATNIIIRRKSQLHQKMTKPALKHDYLIIDVPEWSREAVDYNPKTYSDYLKLVQQYLIPAYELSQFLDNATVVQEFDDQEDSNNEFGDYLNRNPDMAKLYQEMACQNIELIGLHLKTGDLLTIGERHQYFVVREQDKINLYEINDSFLPEEALPILVQHQVTTLKELNQIYSAIRGVMSEGNPFMLGNIGHYDYKGHIFCGFFMDSIKKPAEEITLDED